MSQQVPPASDTENAYKTIISIDEYVEYIGQIRNNGNDQFWDFDEFVWFRGQSDNFPLRPGFLRNEVCNARFGDDYSPDPGRRDDPILGFERVFNKTAKRRAAAFLTGVTNITHLYLEMQHHGVPTRLLDWSENALVALFFAVSSNPTKDGYVHAFAPHSLLEKQGVVKDIFYTENLEISAEIHDLFYNEDDQIDQPPECNRTETSGKVLPIASNLLPGRMMQQSSCFTFHTIKSPSIENIPNFKVDKICIPASAKKSIQRRLRSLGIDYITIFQDMDSVGRELNHVLLNPGTT